MFLALSRGFNWIKIMVSEVESIMCMYRRNIEAEVQSVGNILIIQK